MPPPTCDLGRDVIFVVVFPLCTERPNQENRMEEILQIEGSFEV